MDDNKPIELIWKDIIGYEGFYKISNLGDVKFLERKVSNRLIKEKFNKIHISKRGYYVTDLRVANIRKTLTIHRLIAIHFIENPNNKSYVNHIDKNPLNNNIENLEWVNNMENVCHSKRFKEYSSKFIGVGWDKYARKWKSQIYHNGKSIHLGNFNSEEEAYKKRIDYEVENKIINKYN